MKVKIMIIADDSYAKGLISESAVGCPVRYQEQVIGKIISSEIQENGKVLVTASIFKEHIHLIKQKATISVSI